MKLQSSGQQHTTKRRAASTVLELLVAGTLLLSLIAVAAPASVRASRLWQASRQHRLASDELCRQIETLTGLPDLSDLDQRLKQWSPDAALAQALPGVRLEGKLINDDTIDQLQLIIHWDGPVGKATVSMVGWRTPSLAAPATEPESRTDSEKAQGNS